MKTLSNGDVVIPIEDDKKTETEDGKPNGIIKNKGKVSISNGSCL